ncbi:hypothetical protein BV898_12946 [Hypsibius exemplaris]|uniref:Uncharacterized protein n=1 Tax=Hypsibius exemplaris TaxID=2072580 RepID=A0A1W0WCB7_HYPEX|nr:hypothetical protein BV898_12946 [Hypsibius exemplaris]
MARSFSLLLAIMLVIGSASLIHSSPFGYGAPLGEEVRVRVQFDSNRLPQPFRLTQAAPWSSSIRSLSNSHYILAPWRFNRYL